MSRAESIWLLSRASTAIGPPRSPEARISSGKNPSSFRHRMSAPMVLNASMSPFIGLLRICGTPSILNVPRFADAHRAVMKRAAVPARPTKISASVAGTMPPLPSTRILRAASSSSTLKPSRRSASAMISVSSLKRAPVRVTGPSHSAESSIARFVRLLEPGTDTPPWTGRTNGLIARRSGRGAVTAQGGTCPCRPCRAPGAPQPRRSRDWPGRPAGPEARPENP